MTDTCPTVKVVADNEDGYMVVNQSDYDANPSDYELYEGAAAVNFDRMKKADLQQFLADHGVEYGDEMNKAELVELCQSVEA